MGFDEQPDPLSDALEFIEKQKKEIAALVDGNRIVLDKLAETGRERDTIRADRDSLQAQVFGAAKREQDAEDLRLKQIAKCFEERDEALRERDAYKKAKAENDERFMLERDEARREVERLRTLSSKMVPESEFEAEKRRADEMMNERNGYVDDRDRWSAACRKAKARVSELEVREVKMRTDLAAKISEARRWSVGEVFDRDYADYKPSQLYLSAWKAAWNEVSIWLDFYHPVSSTRAAEEPEPRQEPYGEKIFAIIQAARAKASVTDIGNCDEWDRQIHAAVRDYDESTPHLSKEKSEELFAIIQKRLAETKTPEPCLDPDKMKGAEDGHGGEDFPSAFDRPAGG